MATKVTTGFRVTPTNQAVLRAIADSFDLQVGTVVDVLVEHAARHLAHLKLLTKNVETSRTGHPRKRERDNAGKLNTAMKHTRGVW